MTILDELEEKIGGNLWVIKDALDLAVRQGDEKIVHALKDLEEAWHTIALLKSVERKAKEGKLYFNAVQDGASVVDSLHYYGTEMFPNSMDAKMRVQQVSA